MQLTESLEVLTILLLGCFALVFWGGSRNDRFLYLAGFLIPLRSIFFQFFVGFTWMLLILPLSIMAIVVYKKRIRWHDIEGRHLLILFFAYAFYLTLFRAFFDYTSNHPLYLQAAAYGWGAAQTTYRYPVQFLSFIFAWGVIFTGFWFTKEQRDVVALIKGYINGNLLNALLGFYQLLAFRWLLPWPTQFQTLDRGQDLATAAARMQLHGLDTSGVVYRLSGIGGEPKHAASSLVMAIVLLLCLKVFGGRDNSIRHSRLKFFVMFTALFLTFSSGGWLAIICVGVYFMVTSFLHGKLQVIGYFLVVLLVLGIVAQVYGGFQFFQTTYETRLTDRFQHGLEGLSIYEPKDAAAIRYALNHPVNMVFGNGTGGVDFRIMTDSYLSHWISTRNSTVTPAYLPTRLLGDLGLVGFVLLGLLLWRWSKKLKKTGLPAYRQFLIAGALVLIFASQQSLSAYLLLCASMVSYACRVEKLNIRTGRSIPGRLYGKKTKPGVPRQ